MRSAIMVAVHFACRLPGAGMTQAAAMAASEAKFKMTMFRPSNLSLVVLSGKCARAVTTLRQFDGVKGK